MRTLPALLVFFVSTTLWAFDHSAYDKMLHKYTHDGRFAYSDLLANKEDLASFRAYLKSLSDTDPTTLPSDVERKTFWVNAYNAFTIDLILQHYPIASIRKISGPFGSPWKKDFFKINGRNMSLDDIEHGTLRKRKEFQDARIHFALVCASKGCPPLQSFAFAGDKIDEQLETIARAYLTDSKKTVYDASSDTLRLNSIMKWYGGDFERDTGSLRKFLKKYLPQITDKTRIEFQEYDWLLNEPDKTPSK